MVNGKVAIVHRDAHFAKILRISIDYFRYFSGAILLHELNSLADSAESDIVAALISIEFFDDEFSWKKGKPGFPIIVLADDQNDKRIVTAINAGAVECIFSSSPPEVYLRVLKSSLEGHPSISNVFAKQLTKELEAAHTQHVFDALSLRENEIVQLLATGKLYKEIAGDLQISIETVKRHCTNIYKKLGVNNRSETIARFYKKDGS